jgi:hypothetical protein
MSVTLLLFSCRWCFQIRGIAAKARGDLSFVVELEELGCVTLMPFSHLLPSQQVQLFMEADMEVPSFICQGKELRNTGYVGEQAAAAMQVWTVQEWSFGQRLHLLLLF